MNENCQTDSLMLLGQGSLTQQWWPLRISKGLPLSFAEALLSFSLPVPFPPPPVLSSWVMASSSADSGIHHGA